MNQTIPRRDQYERMDQMAHNGKLDFVIAA
jgi:hypothetical protein